MLLLVFVSREPVIKTLYTRRMDSNHGGFANTGINFHLVIKLKITQIPIHRDNQRDKWNVCRMDLVTYFHRFMPDQLNCFWPRFIEHREKCNDPGYVYVEEEPFCEPPAWYDIQRTAPILTGENRFRCGPQFNNSHCSVNPRDFKNGNGPCCSGSGYCGSTPNHCYCETCVDFQTVITRE